MSGPAWEQGAELPEQSYRVTRADLVAYAGASGDANPIHWSDRVAVAAGLPVRGAPTGWVQADAGRTPFADQTFEVVCSQLGLQYFPDRPATLAELARVLGPGGRLAAMVWRSIDHSPGFAARADALDRHIGPAAGAIMRAPFGLGDEPPLHDLLTGAGFGGVRLDRQAGTVRFGSARELVTAQVAGSPLAGPVADAGPPPGGAPGRGRGHPGAVAGAHRPRLPDRRPADQRPLVGPVSRNGPGTEPGDTGPRSRGRGEVAMPEVSRMRWVPVTPPARRA